MVRKRSVIDEFATAPLKKAFQMVRLGFECETMRPPLSPENSLQVLSEAPEGHPLHGLLRLPFNTQPPYAESQRAFDSYFRPFKVDPGWDSGRPEYRTQGALTFDEAVTAAKEVFKLNHLFDANCAFHIHISLQDYTIDHRPELQKAAIEYILLHMQEVPKTVRERWRDGKLGPCPIYLVDTSEAKGPFVSPRQTYNDRNLTSNTYEFRCFGKVTNAEDAQKCLELTVRALRYAYLKTRNLKPHVRGPVHNMAGQALHDAWARICAESAMSGVTLRSVRRRKQKAAQAA